jgi:hypothetical protein
MRIRVRSAESCGGAINGFIHAWNIPCQIDCEVFVYFQSITSVDSGCCDADAE